MKTLNTSDKVKISMVRPAYDEEGKQPCWYVSIEKGSTAKDNKWKVGVVHPTGKKDEYSFKFSRIGKDQKSLDKAASKDFGIKLLDVYKKGGQEAVEQWLKNGF